MSIPVYAREGPAEERAEETGHLAAAVAVRLGASPAVVARCRVGALVRDVGKAALPDGVVLKNGPLDEAEWALMRSHTVLGERLLARVPELHEVLPAVRHHHERWDGTGYPDGLAGPRIPLEARVLAAVDAFSAMTAERPYRRARTRADAVAELHRSAGSQLDPAVVEALLAQLSAPPLAEQLTVPGRSEQRSAPLPGTAASATMRSVGTSA
jgi:HD-GYP domain-containing protein (c-di-GMP phosphodiesterase class II)